jgi:RND family efflux transporter MFP subunit
MRDCIQAGHNINRNVLRISLLAVSVALAQMARAQDLATETFDCLVEPKMTVLVGSPAQGVIETIAVERNDPVEQGQVLATLKSDVEIAAMEHARVRATMESEIQAREADLALAEVNMRRIDELIEQQLAPQQQRDEAFAQLQIARMAVKQAKDNKRLYAQDFQRAQEIVEQRVIRSPISGVVVELRAYPGEFVYENPIVTVAQIDPLRVEAILPARFFGRVQAGMLAHIAPEIRADQTLEGVVSGVDRLIDSASGTFSVHLELANPGNTIPGGQSCTVAFEAVELN